MLRRLFVGVFAWLEASLHRTAWATSLLSLLGMGACLAQRFPLPMLLLLAALAAHHRRQRTSDTHGSASWADYSALERAGCLDRSQGLQLGRAAGVHAPFWRKAAAVFFLPPWSSRHSVQICGRCGAWRTPPTVSLPDSIPHAAVFGASGCGKTSTFVVDNLRQDRSAAFILDPKGELLRLTGRARERNLGHRLAVLDPFGLARGQFPAASFNPLALYRDRPETVVDNARRLANALVVRAEADHEPFWNNAAQVVIQSGLAFLMMCVRPEDVTLWRLRQILTSAQLTEQMLAHMETSSACYGLLQRLAGQIRRYQGNTGNSIFAVALTHLEFLDSVPVAKTLHETTFDLADLLRGRLSIYCLLPVDRLRELAGLQRVILTSVINYVFEAGESRTRQVRLYLDEAATLGESEALYNAICFGRSFGLRSLALFQTVSQVQRCFPQSKAADFRGTVASIFAGANDLQTAEEVSKHIGTTTVISTSRQSSFNWGGSHTAGGREQSQGSNWGASRSITRSETGRSLITPDEVLQLPRWAAIALLPGVPPILLEKQPYFRAPSRLRIGLARIFTTLCALLVLLGTPVYAFGLYAFLAGPHDWLVRTVFQFLQAYCAAA